MGRRRGEEKEEIIRANSERQSSFMQKNKR